MISADPTPSEPNPEPALRPVLQTNAREIRFRRSRAIRICAGVAALLLLLARIAHSGLRSGSGPVELIIWATTLLAVVLLLWRERNHTLAHQETSAEYARFILAAETSLEAFFILDTVRDLHGEIRDFRFRYINSHGEAMFQRPRAELLGSELSGVFTTSQLAPFLDKCRQVILTGDPLTEEFSITSPGGERWLRHRIVRLDGGVAITASDASEMKQTEARYRSAASLNQSVFDTAPFAIIKTDLKGIIQSMNAAAERLTGYAQDELAGRQSITVLHESHELTRRSDTADSDGVAEPTGLELLTSRAVEGEVDEREWTYIRRDGSTIPVHVAISAVRDGDGQLSGYVAIASDISERKQMMTYLTHIASHDQLTGLPGRSLLRERIAEAIERALLHSRKVAVFVIDFDHFKRINDSLGHRSGDELLVGLAARMRESLRRSDTLGRLGGDEFVVVMPHIGSIADVERCAKRLVDRVSSAAMIGELEVNLTASVGVCIYPDFGSDADTLLERADAAMYSAKEKGRNQYRIFADEMLRASQERLSMDTALRHALAREEMYLHYQPIVSLSTGRVVGMESLLRWHHPKLGLIHPGTFVPLAEETGQIVPIGEWALKESCMQAKLLSDQLRTDLWISVNLSPRQFEQPTLLDVIDEALHASGLKASQLQIELTENTLMINSASNLEKLQRIREMGARVAIDDFGTGFCSFSYLLQYPVDRLKIDQSFIAKASTEPNAATVVRTIVSMSHNLGIKVIAEGVETPDHLRFLAQRRCDEVQGYFFSRPVAASSFVDVVAVIERTIEDLRSTGALQPGLADNSDLISNSSSMDQPSYGQRPAKQIIM
jgi:diguanylate cyclase (GGDEF)-like protein/PAS domain S-box-containing protein